MSKRKIENEEQYQSSLSWLVEKSKLLEHPLMDGDARAKLNKQYDYVSQKVREYNINQLAESDSEMKQIYEEAGLLPKAVQEPQTQPELENKSINLSDWLDDE